ncbi:prepilin peptidase [Alicyclobacillus macrosporangiidus]|uniref:Type IV leader peptidase family protein n=1 Tax=Alicyclobacillus macrosporangiidus TaxID=392015 RepID=A0A1I7KFA3_9BACL|nr:prepilin peptidase [Alicyclobacillus macrosporangiidus]SFU96069.1 Type IV leader peptidase family protein [Alicyclobacillus macrosporangiidus]
MLRGLVTLFVGMTVLLVAAEEDRRTYTISLWIVLTGVLAGFVLGVVFEGWRGLWLSFAGLALGLLLGTVLSLCVHMGWGDTLLYGVIGAIFGPAVVLLAFVVTNALVLIRFLPAVRKRKKLRVAVAPYMVLSTLVAMAWANVL